MALENITTIHGTGVFIPGADIDTDRIIPARFMKCVTFDGLGEYAFYDMRFDDEGREKKHPLNDDRFKGASVLVTGINFGCGSSREHAPQALYRFGFRAVIAQSFAEIFFGNCVTLGIPCAIAKPEVIEALRAAIEENPKIELTLDVNARQVRLSDGREFDVEIPESAREALTSGHWDPIADLLEGEEAVAETAAALPYMSFRS